MAEEQGYLEEFINDFIVEIGEHSEVIEAELLKMESENSDEGVDEIFRAFHSIKGSASWAGFKKIVELCHQAEEVVNDVRKRGATMDSKRVDLLLDGLDIIKIFQQDSKNDPEGLDDCVRKMSEFRGTENVKKRSGAINDDVDIWKRDDGSISIIMLEGSIGLKGNDKLMSEFVRLEDDGRYKLILDIEKVSFICSSGLGGLAVTLKNFREKGGDLKLVNPSGNVKERLEITELDKQFDVCGTVKGAMSRF